jgi:hypothetical protein
MPPPAPVLCSGGGCNEGGGSNEGSSQRSTLLHTLLNFLNIFVGTGMQSMPYALMRGGWLALAALILIMPLFALSGQVGRLATAAAAAVVCNTRRRLLLLLRPSSILCTAHPPRS